VYDLYIEKQIKKKKDREEYVQFLAGPITSVTGCSTILKNYFNITFFKHRNIFRTRLYLQHVRGCDVACHSFDFIRKNVLMPF
jgi:hypothetical protein